ncbi:MAG: hypothetical protein GY861_10030 [bacterium]|nr:hypothetical protein [bacterium]
MPVKTKIQEFEKLRFFVSNGFDETVEPRAIEAKADIIKVRFYDEKIDDPSYFYKSRRIRYYMWLPEKLEDVAIKKEKRKRVRQLESKGIKINIESPIKEESFNEWLKIYSGMINDMGMGVMHADTEFFESKKERLIGIFAYDADKMVGGSIIWLKRESEKIIPTSAFKAADHEYVKEGVNDALVYNFIKWSHENGYRLIKSGVDSNFYGYHLNHGLFLYKTGWGFKPYASKKFEHLKILNFEKYEDVSFFFSGKEKLIGHLILKKDADKKFIDRFKGDYELKVYKVVDNKLTTYS